MATPATVISPTLLAARRAKSDPALNFLTYQHMDQLYAVAPVPALKDHPGRDLRPGKGDAIVADAWGAQLEDFAEAFRFNAIAVVHDGELVRELYRNGSTASTQFIGFSMSKSIISTLVGIAIADGVIHSVDDEVTQYMRELKGTAFDGVTLRHLLMMQSGTDWQEVYEPGSALDCHRDNSLNRGTCFYEDFAAQTKRLAAPGTRFNYSTLDTNLVGHALERAIGQPLAVYMATRLWQPMGAEHDGYWVLQGMRDAPRPFYGGGFAATLRDWARLGQLTLNNGQARGTQIVPATWMRSATSRLIEEPGFGYSWWMHGNEAYGAWGIFGQYLYIDPASRTVIAAAGYWTDAVDAQKAQQTIAHFQALAGALSNAPAANSF